MSKQITFFILMLLTFTLSAQKTYIHCGVLIDAVSNQPQLNKTIVIENDKIVDVKDGFVTGTTGDKVIDLKNKTVMPGLMDMHVHVESETKKGAVADRFTQNPADIAFEAARIAHVALMAGFTTIRDLGGTGVNIALRNAINKGITIGPRIYTAGKIIASTGGHGDPTNGYRKDLMGDPGANEGVVNGTEDARKAVRQRYKDGSDLIKITATGGVLSQAKDG
ncbi:MAG TPA: amidohydrolase family protein, partial [Chitinophagaceae bacterium]|nr:amidohydrolase family protein [Chitinophagaceae bacterium]